MSENKARTVFRVVSGNFLEMYDFMVYIYFASYIAAAYFPAESEFASHMAALAVFGAGFLMRPLGAIVLGSYIDRHGRRKGLLVTLSLMACGTLLVAAVPGYATIGPAAPLLVLSGRLLQGFSAGVELGGVSVYLAEISPPGREGFFTSWQSASQQLAVVFAALLGFALSATLEPSTMAAIGWRIPFFVGCAIIPFVFVIRDSLAETPVFAARKVHPTLRQIADSMLHNWKLILGGMCLVIMSTVNFYLITGYTPTFGRTALALSEPEVLTVTICVGVSNFLWLPIMGSLSDRVGRKPLLLTFSTLAIVTAYPAMMFLAAQPSFERLLGVELWLSFIYASYNGTVIVTLTEIMPSEVRTVGFSLAYSLATTLGGFTPTISTYLIHALNNKAAPGLCALAAGVAGLVGTLTLLRQPRKAAA
jgi:MFS family permease